MKQEFWRSGRVSRRSKVILIAFFWIILVAGCLAVAGPRFAPVGQAPPGRPGAADQGTAGESEAPALPTSADVLPIQASVQPTSANILPSVEPELSSPTPNSPPAQPPQPSPALTATNSPYPDLGIELPAGGAVFTLPLTIRHLTENQAVLFFELSQPAEGFVLYQQVLPERAETRAVPLEAGQTRHQVTLGELAPEAEYRAVVAIADAAGQLSQPVFQGAPWGSLRLRPWAAGQGVRVGVFGDASFGDPATTALIEQMLANDLDFVIHTGDVVYGVDENDGPYDAYAVKYFQTMAPLLRQMPVYTVIGNHDYDAPARWQGSAFYYHAFPPFSDAQFGEPAQPGKMQYYALAIGDIQFVLLDSQVIYGVEGREAQAAWLAERLADTRFRHSIPVFHVPPFFSGAVHPEDQIAVRQSWHLIFTAADVPLALSGHSHHYERLAADGITYVVSGGGSGTLYAPGEILPQSQLFARRTHFVLLEISPERIQLSAIDKEGEIFDQAEVALP